MPDHDPLPAPEMIRLPGLYRSWELPQLLQPGRRYRIEGAGFHEDGTPLLAVYVEEAEPCGADLTITPMCLEHRHPGATDRARPE